MNLIAKLKLDRLFSSFDIYISNTFPELPFEKFQWDDEFYSTLQDLKNASDSKSLVESLNIFAKKITDHCKLNGYIFKVVLCDELPGSIVGYCNRIGLLNFEILIKKFDCSAMTYFSLVAHEFSHAYQLANNHPFYNPKNMKASEKFTDYLLLYLGFEEEIIWGYSDFAIFKFSKLNYLQPFELEYGYRKLIKKLKK